MTLHPDIQQKAQQQVEETIGDRLPVPEDYTSMPYISALIKEVMRWGTVVPLGPHLFLLLVYAVTITATTL